jgi:hypothetical protein
LNRDALFGIGSFPLTFGTYNVSVSAIVWNVGIFRVLKPRTVDNFLAAQLYDPTYLQ